MQHAANKNNENNKKSNTSNSSSSTYTGEASNRKNNSKNNNSNNKKSNNNRNNNSDNNTNKAGKYTTYNMTKLSVGQLPIPILHNVSSTNTVPETLKFRVFWSTQYNITLSMDISHHNTRNNYKNIKHNTCNMNNRQINIYFDDIYKMLIKLKNIITICTIPKSQNSDLYILYIHMYIPPLVFTIDQSVAGTEDDYNTYGYTDYHTNDYDYTTNNNNYSNTQAQSAAEARYIRCTDPTKHSVLGQSLHYCLEFDPRQAPGLIEAIDALSYDGVGGDECDTSGSSDESTKSNDSASDSDSGGGNLGNGERVWYKMDRSLEFKAVDWCGGFAERLSGLSFPIKYLLHALISVGKLEVASESDADELVQRLNRCPTAALTILNDAFILPYIQLGGMGLASLLTALEACNDEREGTVEKTVVDDAGGITNNLGALHLTHCSSQCTSRVGSTTQDHSEDSLSADEAEDEASGASDELVASTATAMLGTQDEVEVRFHAIRRVVITPLRVCPQPPVLDFGNRILRHYAKYRDRFIRIAFADEDFGSILQPNFNLIHENRIRNVIQHGIYVAGLHFIFLAYSNSQLRDQCCWFYCERYDKSIDASPPPTADAVRASMGDLSSIRSVSKYAARLGLGLSASELAVYIDEREVAQISDIMRLVDVGDWVDSERCFSDGIGVISQELAERISRQLDPKSTHVYSAFQIRYRGCKGVVAIDPTGTLLPPGCHLGLRPSMTKFTGNKAHNSIDILATARPFGCYLNRQIITLLSTLGVPDIAFTHLLHCMLTTIEKALTDLDTAKELITQHSNTNDGLLRLCFKVGINVLHDPYLCSLIQALARNLLSDLKNKARILVPNGANLIGIIDESQTLPYECIYYQTRAVDGTVIRPLHGTRVMVYRNPSVHPGDVRIMTFCDLPAYHGLFDVAVFPTLGDRPPANEMSGGKI